jgi:hypothetical protein
VSHQMLPTPEMAGTTDREVPERREFSKRRRGLILGALVIGLIGVLGVGVRSGLLGQ